MIVLYFMSTATFATNICWIDHVSRTSNGMMLGFSTNASLLVNVTHQNDRKASFYVTHGVVQDGQRDGDNNVVLNSGDTVFLNTPQNLRRCQSNCAPPLSSLAQFGGTGDIPSCGPPLETSVFSACRAGADSRNDGAPSSVRSGARTTLEGLASAPVRGEEHRGEAPQWGNPGAR